jgi:hypothetical protein
MKNIHCEQIMDKPSSRAPASPHKDQHEVFCINQGIKLFEIPLPGYAGFQPGAEMMTFVCFWKGIGGFKTNFTSCQLCLSPPFI